MASQRFKHLLSDIVQLSYAAAADSNLGIEAWASKAKLHPKTIERIATGQTRFPYFQTVVAMAQAVGVDVYARRGIQQRKRGAA
jgi:hypothetical protein